MTDTTDQSRRAQKAPLPPEVLADALHDKTHENSGRLLHASPIVVSDNAALLRDLDAAAAGVQRLDRLDAESAAKAIRGLEAQVTVLTGLDSYGAAKIEELSADRDRLAGEVEMLTKHVSRLEHANDTAFAELAAARENEARYLWLRDWSTDSALFYLSVNETYAGKRFKPAEVDAHIDALAAIDAARRAGEGEK